MRSVCSPCTLILAGARKFDSVEKEKEGKNAAKKRCNLNTNKLYVVRKKKWIIDKVRNYLWDASD